MYTSAGHCFTACVKRAGQGEAVATWGFKVNFITVNQAAGTLHRRPGPHAQADEDDTVESNNLDHDDDLHKMD